MGEIVCCELKVRNAHDPFAVALKKAGSGIVGHQQAEIEILYCLVSTSCCQTISTSEVITVLMSSVQKLFCCTKKLINNNNSLTQPDRYFSFSYIGLRPNIKEK